MRVFRIATLIAYAVCLSVWSATIAYGLDGSAVVAAIPVAGWLYTVAKFALWATPFAGLAVLWLLAVIVGTLSP